MNFVLFGLLVKQPAQATGSMFWSLFVICMIIAVGISLYAPIIRQQKAAMFLLLIVIFAAWGNWHRIPDTPPMTAEHKALFWGLGIVFFIFTLTLACIWDKRRKLLPGEAPDAAERILQAVNVRVRISLDGISHNKKYIPATVFVDGRITTIDPHLAFKLVREGRLNEVVAMGYLEFGEPVPEAAAEPAVAKATKSAKAATPEPARKTEKPAQTTTPKRVVRRELAGNSLGTRSRVRTA